MINLIYIYLNKLAKTMIYLLSLFILATLVGLLNNLLEKRSKMAERSEEIIHRLNC